MHPDRLALAALAALASLLAAACSGEQAFTARDGSALAGIGGTAGGGGKGGTAGAAGSIAGAGNAGTGGAGIAGSGSGGDSGSAGDGGDSGTAGTGGGPGTSGTGGPGTAGNGAAGTAPRGGSGGTGGTGGRGGGGGKAIGASCSNGSECGSGFCFDTVCCMADCTGTCKTCNGANPGTCILAPDGSDPRDQCPMEAGATCGRNGSCNGSGACRFYGSTQVCDATPACNATSSAVVSMKVCNGSGSCVAGPTQSCNGYLCAAGSPPTCGTSCTSDSACVTGGFCSASACYATPNLVGNGDLESGTTTGWGPANGATNIALSAVASAGFAHAGGYSTYVTSRSIFYQGPGYNLPTGAGKYTITAWGMQKDLASIDGVLQVRVVCANNTSYYLAVQPSGFGVPMPQGVWTLFSHTLDFGTAGADCSPTGATPGMVRLANLYLNHTESTTAPLPDLYIDDAVVTVTDGHNLCGNPNFEAGLADGWNLNAPATPAVDGVAAHGGTKSLHLTTRSLPTSGPRYPLPTGAARYAFSFWLRHAGTQTHDLILQPTYTCIGGTAVTPTPIATAAGVAGNTWVELAGNYTLPPADAPAGCRLATAAVYVKQEGTACGTATGQVECPEMFLDDVSITLAP